MDEIVDEIVEMVDGLTYEFYIVLLKPFPNSNKSLYDGNNNEEWILSY